VGKPDSGALVVFWEAVLAAELSSAVGTLKRHDRFLPALLTVHSKCVTLFLFRRGFSVYMFPQKPTETSVKTWNCSEEKENWILAFECLPQS
jgi:hypothetical protein